LEFRQAISKNSGPLGSIPRSDMADQYIIVETLSYPPLNLNERWMENKP